MTNIEVSFEKIKGEMAMGENKIIIQKESFNGISEYSLASEYLKNRTIFIFGEITTDTANDFAMKLLYLQQLSNDPIKILINSVGGEVYAGLTIYDLIQGSACDIEGYVVGMAASMAAIILMGCKKGSRFILPHSRVMIHEPLVNRIGGSASSVKSFSEDLLRMKETLNNLMAKNTGKTIEEIDKATGFDNFLSSKEAVEFGICDKIINTIDFTQ